MNPNKLRTLVRSETQGFFDLPLKKSKEISNGSHRHLFKLLMHLLSMKWHGGKTHVHCGSGGAVYGLGFLGAAIYYISQATGFWMGVLGILKAIVWPAFLVFEVLKFLGA